MKKKINYVNPIITEAIAKVIASKLAAASELVLDNRGVDHKVTFAVSGEAVVRKGVDYEQVISFALPYDRLFAVAMSKLNGVTVEAIVREATDDNFKTDGLTEVTTKAQEALTAIKGTSRQLCAGKTTVKEVVVKTQEVDICKYC